MLDLDTKQKVKSLEIEPLLEANFPIQPGSLISSMHGYSLYSALKRQIPWLGDCPITSISSIAGIKNGKGKIETQEFSRLYIRIPLSKASSLYSLAGQTLRIGQGEISLKIPSIAPLTPKSTLKARIVLIHLSPKEPNLSPDRFLAAATRQLQEREIEGKVSILLRQGALDRKVLIVKGKRNPGFGVQVTGLSEEDSLKLKTLGLGGRRKMGAGFFV
ncbi:MAG: type I-MYXAN CRISPR-associated protein Cas6/Cmx6 [Xenococcaceae cyanobacterium MO_188.B32]|nr:type I-MYXAN CRISPR-associated protein Cas6/Cmx6 [Xenococcaceae cyanobacterium MO_188.B32]